MKDVTMHIHLAFSLYPKKIKVHPVVYFLLSTKKRKACLLNLCAAPSYIEKYGQPKSVADLKDHYWVCLPWQRQLKFNEGGQVINYNARTRFTVSNSDNMTQAAIAAHDIAIKSYIAIKDDLAEGRLIEILPNSLVDADAPVWFLKPQNSLVTRKTEVFYEFMKSLFT